MHEGTGARGHYYSYVKENGNRWICYNDTRISVHRMEDFIEKCYGNNVD